MNEELEVQERLKEISAEIATLAEIDERTDEQNAQIEALDKEGDDLTVRLGQIREEKATAALKQKAEDFRQYAKTGTRATAPSKINSQKFGRQRLSVEDDPKRGFKSIAHFATRLFDAGQNVRGDDMLMNAAAGTGMTQGVNSEGGVAIPPAFATSIWERVMVRSNSLLQYCDRITVDPGVESVTVPAINETSRADGSRMGGIRGYWKGELTGLQESRPAFREVKLTPHELFVYAYVSDKLLRNSPQTASGILERGSADEIAFKIGDAVINGDGVGKPRGIVGHTATVSVAKETNQPAATIVAANIRKMISRLHVNWQQGAVWFVNPDVLPVLESMVFEVGTAGVPAYLPPGGLSDTPYSRLYGKPVIPIEYCQTVGTEGDIILANLSAYAAAIKGMVDSSYSMHLKFDYAQTAYRVIFEMDGQPWLNSKITPFKGTNTTSPIVTLATRS